ncbi:MAG: aminotransferase class IV [Flavipsychrobacter sp.]
MNYINLNGHITPAQQATFHPDNRAFRYAYGLFETMLLQDGEIQLKHYHWERLFAGLQHLYFSIPALFTPQLLEDEILKTVKKNKLEKLCRIRLQVYAGSGGMFDAADQKPYYIIECFPLQPDTLLLNENGLQLCIATGLQKSADSLANLKSCNALIYAMAAQQAKQQRCNDALLCNTSGNIIESTIANIFWVKDDIIYTPPLSEGCIAGTMRRYILSHCEVNQSPLTVESLLTAQEVFLTNAIRRIKWVAGISNATYTKSFTNKLFSSLF